LRVGFDARTIDWTGVGTYSRNLLLQFSDMGLDVTVFCMDHTQDLIPASRRLRLVPTDAQPGVPRRDRDMCALVEAAAVDLLHVPCHLAPQGLRVPLVCTIHDVIPLVYPRSIRSPFKRASYRRQLLQVLADAARIVTVSQISLSALSAYANVSLSKVRVIHNGVSEQFRPVTDREQLAAVRDSYNLPGRFAFWIGEFRPNKNLEFLLRSWGALQQQLASLRIDPPAGEPRSPLLEDLLGKTVRLEEGDLGWRTLRLEQDGSGLALLLEDGLGSHRLTVPTDGSWWRGSTELAIHPARTVVEQFPRPVAVSGAWEDPQTLTVTLCFVETPFHPTLRLRVEGQGATLRLDANCGWDELQGREWRGTLE